MYWTEEEVKKQFEIGEKLTTGMMIDCLTGLDRAVNKASNRMVAYTEAGGPLVEWNHFSIIEKGEKLFELRREDKDEEWVILLPFISVEKAIDALQIGQQVAWVDPTDYSRQIILTKDSTFNQFYNRDMSVCDFLNGYFLIKG